MERFAWKARVLDGQLEEYIRHHDEMWPAMIYTILMGFRAS